MIIDAIKKHIEENCELFKGKSLNVNCLGEKPQACVIEPTPCKPVLEQYTDGGSKRQITFCIATREFFDAEMQQNLKTQEFYEALENWIDKQNESNNLPKLEKGYEPVEYEVMNCGYLQDVTGNKARYQINLRLIYERDY